MVTPRPEFMLRSGYPDHPLLERLRSAPFGAAIPEHEFIQFRRLQSLIYAMRPAGYDVEAMSTEAFIGAVIYARVNCKVAVTRCEFDQEVDDKIWQKVKPRLAPGTTMWFATNATTTHAKLRALPIGLSDYCGLSAYHAVIGDASRLKTLIDAHPRSDAGLVLLNFSDRTHPDRPLVRALFAGKSFVTAASYTPDEAAHAAYVRGLRSHAFCLAPRGNGIDTHRMWEALYAGCIPVVQRAPALKDFEDLPVLFVDDWAQAADEAFLTRVRDDFRGRSWDLRKLTLSYWFDEVCKALQ